MSRSRALSQAGLPSMGLGCAELSRDSNGIIDVAIAQGIVYFDTSDCYGMNHESELALGEKIKYYDRSQLFISTKTGVFFDQEGVHVSNAPVYIYRACEASLGRLNTDYLDIFYLHRIDPLTPIQVSMSAMKTLVDAGKIKSIGLSEVTAAQIREAHNIYPISAVQIEYSPWSRDDEVNDVISTCRTLNIAVVAYSPLGRAFFTDKPTDYFQALGAMDYRKILPRYNGDNLSINQMQKEKIAAFAKEKNITITQLVLAWEMTKGFVVIPGTRNPTHFSENRAALDVVLSKDEMTALDALISASDYRGVRYPSEQTSGIFTFDSVLKQARSANGLFRALTLEASLNKERALDSSLKHRRTHSA